MVDTNPQGRPHVRKLVVALTALVALGSACTPGKREPEGPQLSGPGPHLFRASADCSADVTKDLNRFIVAAPAGSTVAFGPTACHRIDGTVVVRGKRDLTLDGAGARFERRTTEQLERGAALWEVSNGSGVSVRNMVVKGNHPQAGTGEEAYVKKREGQHGVKIVGGRGTTVDNVTITDVYGDFVYLRDGATDVTVTNSRFERNGRQGVGIVDAERVRIEGNTFLDVRRTVFDLEPNVADRAIRSVSIANNEIGAYGNRLLMIDKDGTISDIAFVGNRLRGSKLQIRVGDYLEDAGKGERQRNISIIGNSADEVSENAIVQVSDVDGLVVRQNVQPFDLDDDEAAVRAVGSCDVVVEDNQFPGTEQALKLSGDCPD